VAGVGLGSWAVGALWGLGVALKGFLVLLIALLVAAALRRASAGLRHIVWSGGVAALLLLPLISLTLPWRLPVVPQGVHDAVSAALPMTGSHLTQEDARSHTEGIPPAPSDELAERGAFLPSGSALPWLLAAWAAGSLLLLARLGLGAVSLRGVVRRAKPLDAPDWTRPLVEGADRLGLVRLPGLFCSDAVAMPVVCGLLSPRVILPGEAAEWNDARRRAVLFHELAHLRRFDLAANLVSRLACALYWFNPLAWLAARRIRVEGERASDDLVLHVGARPSEYADHLLQIVCGARHAQAPAVAIPMAQPSEFEGRMLAILDGGARREQPSRRQAGGLAALAAALLVPIAAMGPAPKAPAGAGLVVAALPSAASESAADSARRSGSEIAGPEGGLERRSRETERVGSMLAALIGGLNGPEAGGRLDAARALGAIGGGARLAVPALGERLLVDPNPEARSVSAWAIGQTGSLEGTRYLDVAALRDTSVQVRVEAVSALGRIADPTSVSGLAAALGDASDQVRAVAAWGLGTVCPPSAPPALIAALSDPAHSVQEHAAWALGQIRDPAAVPGLAVLAMEPDSNSKAGYEALWALARIGGEAARPALTEALSRGQIEGHLGEAIAAALAGRRVEPQPRPWHGRPPF